MTARTVRLGSAPAPRALDANQSTGTNSRLVWERLLSGLSKSRSNFYENDFVGVWCVRGPCRDIGIGTIGQSYRRVSMCSGLPRRRGRQSRLYYPERAST